MRAVFGGGVSLYLILAFGLAWEGFFALRALGAPELTLYAAFVLTPAIAAGLVRGPLRHEGFEDAGLWTADVKVLARTLLTAYGVVPLLVITGIALTSLTGLRSGGLDDLSEPAGVAALIALVLPVLAAPLHFGEEFGWRGYLLPRLAPLGGIQAVVATGTIWGVWHAPLIVYQGAAFPDHRLAGIALITVMTIAFGAVLAWLRFRSGTIWPCCLAHAAWNFQGSLWLTGTDESGSLAVVAVALVPTVAFAVWLALTGRLEPSR
jgi:uncharacterized protein